jgi:hypothetical protein
MNKQQQSSALVMALAIIAATMLVSTVIVEALDLIDDAEALTQKNVGSGSSTNLGANHDVDLKQKNVGSGESTTSISQSIDQSN